MKNLDFDQWIPETDEEVEKKFNEMYSSQLAITAMCGIYRCRRAQGEEVLKAYENTLKDYIKNTEYKHLVS